MSVRANIEPLVWENQFFFAGDKVSAKLVFSDNAPVLTRECLQAYRLLQAKVSSQHHQLVDHLMASGFQLVESEVDCAFTKAVLSQYSKALSLPSLRLATTADSPRLTAIARQSFRLSRFRAPWYHATASSDFYAQWLVNAIQGQFDDECWLWQDAMSVPQGFITLRWLPKKQARIGLFAVNQQQQKQGIGQQLLQLALSRCQQQDSEQLLVATQLSNLTALNLYLRYQAKISQTAYWLYRTPL